MGERQKAESEWTLATLKAYYDELRAVDRRELEKQAVEYERRLSDLNHAHDQARETLSTYLPRETWEGWLKEEHNRRDRIDSALTEGVSQSEYDRRHASLEDRVSASERWQANVTGRYVAFASFGAVLIAVASAAAAHALGG